MRKLAKDCLQKWTKSDAPQTMLGLVLLIYLKPLSSELPFPSELI